MFLKKEDTVDLNKLSGLFDDLNEANSLIEQLSLIVSKNTEKYFYNYD